MRFEQIQDINIKVLEALQRGDEAAFEKVYHHYATKIFLFSNKMLSSHPDAQEAVQETFIRLWKNKHKIQTHQSFDGYIFKIAKNVTLNLLRKNVNQQIIENEFYYHVSKEERSPEQFLLTKELKEEINQMISQLPKRAKQVFLLKREEGLSNKEIAHRLNISVSTVENHINKAQKQIKNSLNLSTYLLALFF